MNCKHCFVGKNSLVYPKRVALNVGLSIIDKLYKLGVKELFFTTREPLLNPYICQYIERCTERGIKTTLITNGICLADEKLSAKLIESGLCSISTSLDGATADTNDKIRGERSFEKTLFGIEVFQRQLYKHCTSMPINLQMSLNSYSGTVCEDLPKLINELPFDSISIGSLSNTGNAKLNQDIILPDDKYFEMFAVIAREYLKITDPNYVLIFKSLMPWEAVLLKLITGYDIYPVAPYCSILNGTFSMLPNGNIVPCISLLNDDKSKCISLEDLVTTDNHDTVFSESIREIKATDCIIKKGYCKDCHFADKCFLCPALANNELMRDAAISRCIKAKNQFEEFVENRYKHGCYLRLDKAQVLFKYREVIMQKNYADTVKKEFRFQLSGENMHIIEELLRGSLFRKQSFQSEIHLIQTLIIEGIIALQEGREYE